MQSWNQCKNILCIRLDNMGDVLMTSPAFRALKESIPGVRLTLLTSETGSNIAQYIPELDDIIIANVPWVKISGEKDYASLQTLADKLRQKNFDGAIIFTTFSQSALPSALLAYLAGIPDRLGYSRENPYELLNYWIPDTEPFTPLKHEVSRQLKLVAAIGAKTSQDTLSLQINEKAPLALENKLEMYGIKLNAPFLTVHAGASEEKRRYPIELLAQAIIRIRDELHYQIILTGNKQEKATVNKLAKIIGKHTFTLAGELKIEELIALIGLSDLLISNNSGPVHIAAAVGTKVVDLYARTNPQHTPWKVENRVLYFDVPIKLAKKNQLILRTLPVIKNPFPRPEDIIQAVRELLHDSEISTLPPAITHWEGKAYKRKKEPAIAGLYRL